MNEPAVREHSAFQPLEDAHPLLRRGERIAGWAVGLVFAELGITALVVAGSIGAGPIVAAVALAGLGAQALWATARGRHSWLARIGPLP